MVIFQRSKHGSPAAAGDPVPEPPALPASETPGTGADQREPHPAGARRAGRRFADAAPLTLTRAAHPKQALVTAVVVAGAAAASGRPAREVGVVAAAVLVGQTILGWHNDVTDRDRDARHAIPGKPVADGRLDTSTVWYAIVIAILLVIPLSLSTGVTAGTYYLVALIIGLLADVALRKGLLSWLPWAATFALYPFYLSYGGWGGAAKDAPPQVAMVVLAALLGVGVHVLRSVWGLVPDDADGWATVPLRLGRRVGAQRLFLLAAGWCVLVAAAMIAVGATVGLRA